MEPCYPPNTGRSPKEPRDMEPKQHRSPVNHPRTNFLRGSANGCSSDSTFSCRRSHIHVQCVGARTKKGAVCRNNTDVASIIVRCPGILQGFPGSSGKSPRLDWNIRDQFCKIGEAHSEVHVGSNLIPKQRYKCCAAADLRDTGTTDSSYPASDKSYP